MGGKENCSSETEKEGKRQKVKREGKVSDFFWHSCALNIEFEYIFQKRISPYICNSKLLANSTVSPGISSLSLWIFQFCFSDAVQLSNSAVLFIFFPEVMWLKVYYGVP